MIRAALGFTAILTAMGIAGHYEQRDEIAADQHYCDMVSLQDRYTNDHPLEIGKDARARRPGWPVHRNDIDCRDYGYSFAYNLSNP